jgi:hypothetical protein
MFYCIIALGYVQSDSFSKIRYNTCYLILDHAIYSYPYVKSYCVYPHYFL